jgi:hypothetical protein
VLRVAERSGGKAVVDEVESGVVDTSVLEPAATNVDAPRLTMATWRQGKKRRMIKRVNHFGGQTVAPPAFLEAAKRTWFTKGFPNHKTCSATKRDGKPCGMRALKGMSVCAAHGGQLALARQGRLQKSGRAAAAIAAKAEALRAKMPEGRPNGVPPLDLIRLRIYQRASERQRIRLALAYGTDAWHGIVMSMQEREREREDPPPGGDRNR